LAQAEALALRPLSLHLKPEIRCADPKILLLDEPFAALDAQTREIMQTELLSIWQETGKTVMLVTHQIDEAVFLADSVVVLSARPGGVREKVKIDLPWPRTLQIKRQPEFMSFVDRIWKLIEAEVRVSLLQNV
jgi:NitT/TauT family transport system ATP-binding protein